MDLQDLHQVAENSTPQSVSIPQTWGGLIAFAIAKWGAGAIFLCLLVPVYMDLKSSNQQFVEISKANVTALTALAKQVEENSDKTEQLARAVERLEVENSRKQ